MNKTEYMNTLSLALQGLPAELIEQTMWVYDKKFSEGVAAGSSEADIAAKLANPRVVAAQKRADLRLQKLKGNFSVGNFARMVIAMVGLLFLNFFMLIPAFLIGGMMFAAYVTSMILYGTGIVVMAASLSGVPEMQFKVSGSHAHRHHNYNHDRLPHFGPATVHLDGLGIRVDREGNHTRLSESYGVSKNEAAFSKSYNTVTIKNTTGTRHVFLGFGLLLLGTCLLLACLQMTRLSLIGFKNYLLWNVSLLRAPAPAPTPAPATAC